MAALLRPGVLRACRNLAFSACKTPLSYARISQKSLTLNAQLNVLPNLSAVRYFSDNTPSEFMEDLDFESSPSSTGFGHGRGYVQRENNERYDRRRDRGKIGRNRYDRLIQKLGTLTTRSTLVRVFEELAETEAYISHLQAYQIMRNCGKELIYETPESRTELAHYFWDKLQAKGVTLDIMLYNALLSVYLQNSYKFNPLEVLEQIQNAGLEPNLTTMALVIQGFGQNGDIQGVFKVLEFMKAADMPVTEPVYTSLIMAYGKTGDMESAKGVFNMMRENGLQPGIDSYIALLTVYAEMSDLTAIDETISEMQEARVYPTLTVYMSLIDTFSRCGRHDIIKQILEKKAVRRLVESDLQSLMISLAGRGEVKSALVILDFLPHQNLTTFGSNPQYLLLKQIIFTKQSTESIMLAVDDLNTRGSLKDVYETALDLSFSIKRPETSIAIIKEMFDKNVKVKQHYFYPMLATHASNIDTKGAEEILTLMAENNIGIDPLSLNFFVKSFGQPKDADIDAFLNVSKDVALSPYFLKMMAQLSMETGNVDKLKTIFDAAKEAELPDRVFQQALGATMKKRSFDAHNCVQVLKEMKARGITRLLEFDISDAIENSCCKTRNGCKEALKFLELMLTEDLQDLIDSRTYTAVMKHLNQHGLHEEFFKLIGVMKQHRVPLDEHHYRQMIRMFSYVGETKPAQFCFDNYKKLVEPNEKIYSHLISAYGHSKDGGFFSDHTVSLSYKNLEKIIEIYEEMNNLGLIPDDRAKSYVIMSYLTLRRIQDADAAKERFGSFGRLTYRVQARYLKTYSDTGDVQNAERVLEELKTMENAHLGTYPYSLAIGVYKFHGDIEAQRRLLAEMKTAGVPANGYTYGEIMRTFLFKEDAEGAMTIMEEAKADNCFPAVGTCMFIINVAARTLSRERVEQIVMDMFADAKNGLSRKTDIFMHSLIYTCLANDRPDLALSVMKDLPNHIPQLYVTNATKAARRGESDAIQKCMEFLKENNVDYNSTMLVPLIKSYETNQDHDSALAAYNKFIEEGGEPWFELQQAVAKVLRKGGQPIPFKQHTTRPRRSRQYKSEAAEADQGEESDLDDMDSRHDNLDRETLSDK